MPTHERKSLPPNIFLAIQDYTTNIENIFFFVKQDYTNIINIENIFLLVLFILFHVWCFLKEIDYFKYFIFVTKYILPFGDYLILKCFYIYVTRYKKNTVKIR